MLHSLYINVLVEERDDITIATNSICHRRTKGTYPDYNCSDDNARFIALSHFCNQKSTIRYLYAHTVHIFYLL